MTHIRSLPGTALAAALLLTGVLTGGCSAGNGGGTPGGMGTASGEVPAVWATSTNPVDTSGLIWATGGLVHLADDGTSIDVGGPITTYVVAGDGVYFTPADSDDAGTEHSNMSTAPLHFADRDGTVTDTGLTIYVESLGSSPDGRYLGLIDATSGQPDAFSDKPQATAVVIDLTTGKRVVDTTEGMGDPDEDDLAHDYPETFLSVRFPDTNAAFVEGLGEDHLYALPGGEGEIVDQIDSGIRDPSDPTNPDATWTIDDQGDEDVLLASRGDRVRPRTGTPRWNLGWWIDNLTVVGAAISGPGSDTRIGPDDTATLMTCEVPSGDCRPVEGTAGAALRFPIDDSPVDAVNLRGGS